MRWLLCFILGLLLSCGPDSPPGKTPLTPAPALLLVTLDTTRADRVGGAHTPHLTELASKGLSFTHAYATAPMTLPSHVSMFTGLYPSEHGVRENARMLPSDQPLLTNFLKKKGYTTAAFVAAYPLAAEFGLSRGFDHYDDRLPNNRLERGAREVTDQALSWLDQAKGPLFVWVHYFDPHHPYNPPEPFRTNHASDLYQGEIAFMDSQIERLTQAFLEKHPQGKMLIAGDHGEGLGEHGEQYHGHLLYKGTVKTPLILVGPGIKQDVVNQPVSIRRVYHTLAAWAGASVGDTLENPPDEVVMGEAMKPYLQYGWSPQVFAVEGNARFIQTATLKSLDLEDQPNNVSPSSRVLEALEHYQSPEKQPEGLSQEQLERLASLGYSSSAGLTSKKTQLPEPDEMTHLFADLDKASDSFVQGRYEDAVTVFNKIHAQDPDNPSLSLRQAVAYSLLDREQEALTWFKRAGQLIPDSPDLHHYLGMHYTRFGQDEKAASQFERVLEGNPESVKTLSALAGVRERQGRPDLALALLSRAATRSGDYRLFEKAGHLHMEQRDSLSAVSAFENARALSPDQFESHLELGVCYMDVERFQDAAFALDAVPNTHPGYAMALFKRAQVSVLLGEPDASERIDRANRLGNAAVRALIQREPLFKSLRP